MFNLPIGFSNYHPRSDVIQKKCKIIFNQNKYELLVKMSKSQRTSGCIEFYLNKIQSEVRNSILLFRKFNTMKKSDVSSERIRFIRFVYILCQQTTPAPLARHIQILQRKHCDIRKQRKNSHFSHFQLSPSIIIFI